MNASVDEADRADALAAARARVDEYLDQAMAVVRLATDDEDANLPLGPTVMSVALMIQRETLRLEDRLDARDWRMIDLAQRRAERDKVDRFFEHSSSLPLGSGHGERG